jgi:hypothetical protein
MSQFQGHFSPRIRGDLLRSPRGLILPPTATHDPLTARTHGIRKDAVSERGEASGNSNSRYAAPRPHNLRGVSQVPPAWPVRIRLARDPGRLAIVVAIRFVIGEFGVVTGSQAGGTVGLVLFVVGGFVVLYTAALALYLITVAAEVVPEELHIVWPIRRTRIGCAPARSRGCGPSVVAGSSRPSSVGSGSNSGKAPPRTANN